VSAVSTWSGLHLVVEVGIGALLRIDGGHQAWISKSWSLSGWRAAQSPLGQVGRGERSHLEAKLLAEAS